MRWRLTSLWGFLFVSSSEAAIREIVLSAETIRDFGELSKQNVEIVKDAAASNGLAIHFTGGANNPPLPNPTAWFQVKFRADAAKYFIWVRGKSDGDTSTDSLWFQFNEQIGTSEHTAHPDAPDRGLGNWRDAFPAGKYAWGSQEVPPAGVVTVTFKNAGIHTLLVQPRQVPHSIDQILLSQTQEKRPDDKPWPSDPKRNPLPVLPEGKAPLLWGRLKGSR